jgi:hypothetical protein
MKMVRKDVNQWWTMCIWIDGMFCLLQLFLRRMRKRQWASWTSVWNAWQLSRPSTRRCKSMAHIDLETLPHYKCLLTLTLAHHKPWPRVIRNCEFARELEWQQDVEYNYTEQQMKPRENKYNCYLLISDRKKCINLCMTAKKYNLLTESVHAQVLASYNWMDFSKSGYIMRFSQTNLLYSLPLPITPHGVYVVDQNSWNQTYTKTIHNYRISSTNIA